MISISLLAGIALFLLGALGCYQDVRWRVLPNWLCLLTLLLGTTYGAMIGGTDAVSMALVHSGIALIIGMALFHFRLIGGGDAKFYTAMAAWFSIHDGLRLLVSVSVSGLILLLAWFAYRRLMKKSISVHAEDSFSKLPYGVAIASGSLVTYIALNLNA